MVRVDHLSEDRARVGRTSRGPIEAHTVPHRGDTSHYPLYEFSMKV
jgi:hypothetical protein